MNPEPLTSIVLHGSGLALWMSAAALSRSLPDGIDLTVIETEDAPFSDLAYGQVLPPEFYAFHLSIGLTEPELLLMTSSTFAYGTEYMSWPGEARSWVQAFHQPLPIWEGVPMTKLLARHPSARLQDCLISAEAARRGVFAHPPDDGAHPLSRAEYGYAVDLREIAALYRRIALKGKVRLIQTPVRTINSDTNGVHFNLEDGTKMSADLHVDCTGTSDDIEPTRSVRLSLGTSHSAPSQSPARQIETHQEGWRSTVALRSGSIIVETSSGDGQSSDTSAITLPIGSVSSPWVGNRVRIGQTASTIEPLTIAPMKLLRRDVDRLLSLIPVSTDMQIEAREYNRQFAEDYRHAAIFHQAHFAGINLPEGGYWQEAGQVAVDPKLDRKLVQYAARGHLVTYDKEPFDALDWAVLHDGMGRTPNRIDPLASLIPMETIDAHVATLRQSIAQVVAKMPPHPVYVGKFLAYLERKYG